MSSMQSQPLTFLSRWAWLLFPLLAFGAVAATFGLLKYVGPKLPFILPTEYSNRQENGDLIVWKATNAKAQSNKMESSYTDAGSSYVLVNVAK